METVSWETTPSAWGSWYLDTRTYTLENVFEGFAVDLCSEPCAWPETGPRFTKILNRWAAHLGERGVGKHGLSDTRGLINALDDIFGYRQGRTSSEVRAFVDGCATARAGEVA
ncbi:hypothetical protein [Actinomadura hibisca]|uniref:hypothetical protein n=1 Tax=Actinomadura hibisca TaxID=68565 RepID=UPI0008310581|nr:hypothetical protein [Actinomadura hibisca]